MILLARYAPAHARVNDRLFITVAARGDPDAMLIDRHEVS